MYTELDTVVLTRDIPEYHLARGDIGAIVHRYGDGEAYEVEFVAAEGQTVALISLSAADIRPMHQGEILHARELTTAA
jgi:hypothetical protein